MDFGISRSGLHRNALLCSFGMTIAGLIWLELAFGLPSGRPRDLGASEIGASQILADERLQDELANDVAVPTCRVCGASLFNEYA